MSVEDGTIFENQGIFSQESIGDFLAEAEEQLSGFEEQLLSLERKRSSREPINELFRHLHGLKGNTGLLLSEAKESLPRCHPLFYVQKGSHAVESLVDRFRADSRARVSDEEIALLFLALGILQKQIRAFQEGRLVPVRDPSFFAGLGLSEADFQDTADTSPPSAPTTVFQNVAGQSIAAIRIFLETVSTAGRAEWKNFHRSVTTLIKAARYADHDVLVRLGNELAAIADENISFDVALSNAQASKLHRLQQEVENEFSKHAAPEALESTRSRSAPAGDLHEEAKHGLIRVDQRKIDDLLRMAGQLLVLRNGFSEIVGRVRDSGSHQEIGHELGEMSEAFSRASEDIRAGVVALRLLPLRNLFKRLHRLVRDLSVSLEKEIHLATAGAELELDKVLLDQIGEPLVHLLRNAADHGIEPPEVRVKSGKPKFGAISVSALREGAQIAIRVSDDGKGLDCEAITAKAIELGIVTPEAAREMSKAAIHALVFHSGFSTSGKVTAVSGRGVGMDSVRNTIHALGGTLHVESRAGVGTTVRMQLPASLLISKGIVVESHQEEYILPLGSIRDLVRIDSEQIRTYRNIRLATVGARAMPLIFLTDLLNPAAERNSPATSTGAALQTAVLEHGALTFGLVVDRFKGETEAIIQPLTDQLPGYHLCVGAAIIGTGRVVLVLNPDALAEAAFDLACNRDARAQLSAGLSKEDGWA